MGPAVYNWFAIVHIDHSSELKYVLALYLQKKFWESPFWCLRSVHCREVVSQIHDDLDAGLLLDRSWTPFVRLRSGSHETGSVLAGSPNPISRRVTPKAPRLLKTTHRVETSRWRIHTRLHAPQSERITTGSFYVSYIWQLIPLIQSFAAWA